MTTETPAQRRARLIEQYCALVFSNAEPSCSMTAIVKYAVDLADAVIAATPQPEPEHAKEQYSGYEGITEEAKKFMQEQFYKYRDKDRVIYPSEIETRLIVLVEYCLVAPDPLDRKFVLNTLTAIKRDLGLV